ncbi:hypothetical protein GPECTOR_69g445 [Gonium pectorale]|uniref:phytol kinase n=1 Tax=Gonium pectorale TaxID=33097 RepID=A0A150G3A1_GONPE|nr:hypothetical protein GPECTOR_69g445 [Gonium pectorale]|eukprot:KXZ44352.1 hypothetical protein GPECTOR_69g445 [Gonium pectorale]
MRNLADALQALQGLFEASQPLEKVVSSSTGPDESPLAALSRADLMCLKRHLSGSVDALVALEDDVWGDPVAITLLSEERTALTLLHLALSAVRTAPDRLGADAERADTTAEVVSRSLDVVLWAFTRAVMVDESAPSLPRAARAFMRLLLRAQTLQAAGRSLAAAVGEGPGAAPPDTATEAEVASAPVPPPGNGEQSAEQGQQHPPPHAGQSAGAGGPEVAAAASIAAFVIQLTADMAYLAQTTGSASSTKPDRQLAADLARALADSAALQHACRVLLLLAPRTTAAIARSCVLRPAAPAVGMALEGTHHLADVCAKQDPISAALLYGVASDRCVQTAALAVGLAELCAADGGPAYGMPPGLLRGLTALFGVSSGGASGCGGSCGAEVEELFAGPNMRSVMRLAYPSIRWPPPGRHALLSIALRVMRLAVASAESKTETEGEPTARGAGNSISTAQLNSVAPAEELAAGTRAGPRLLLEPSGVWGAFIEVAYAARFLLRLPLKSEPVAEAAELWRLLGLGLRWRRVWTGEDRDKERWCRQLSYSMRSLAERCIVAAQTGHNDLTPEPPPSLAAALAGGVLPLTEMLLRRAVSEHVPAAITRGLLSGEAFAASAFLAQLLAYGEPRQAAALVATVGKVLALTDPRVVTAAVGEPQEDTQQCVVNAACDLLVWGLRWWEETAAATADSDAAAAAAAGPSAVPPVRRRLADVLSCAACAWLPALSRLAFAAVQALAPAAKEGNGGSSPTPDDKASAAGAFTLLGAVLPWLPLLARASELRTAAAGSGAASRGGSGSGEVRSGGKAGGGGGSDGSSGSRGGGCCDRGEDGGWRKLNEACAPVLRSLGCSLRLAAAAPPGGVPVGALRGLVAACRLVESWPHEPWATEADGAPLQASWPPGALGAVAEQLRAASALDPAATAERLEASRTRQFPAGAAVAAGSPATASAYVPAGQSGGGEARAGHIEEEEEEEEGHWGRRAAQGGSLPVPLESLARSLLPPSQSRRAMRSCGNPACTVLSGDSEAERPPLKTCAGCGAVGYCCRDCQIACVLG